jgi:branched-chain amino acid transport system substrate-binding protein
MNIRRISLSALSAAALAVAAVIGAPQRAEAQQFIPVLVYDTGAFAVNGQPFMDGFVDYMAMLNTRDGGINGVKLAWEECETGYKNDRGVECYERLKNKGPAGASMFNPLSTGITYALIERASKDKVPVVSLGYGRTAASDGRVFPWIFPLVTNYWSQNTAKIKFIAMKEGGMDKLKGLKIANVLYDGAYGKETIPILEKQAEMYGFTVKHFPIAGPGLDQKATWLQIRRDKPDWVIIRGWGVMNQTSIKEAARVGFPVDHLLGVWWSCAEQDTVPAGAAAKGYTCAGFHAAGKDFAVIQDILKHVYAKGDGAGPDKAVGTIMWNRGVVTAMFSIEGIKTAQAKFGNKPMTGEQVRWGLENLNLTEADIEKIGFKGLASPLKVSCLDHEGGGGVKFQQWTGTGWKIVSDWIATDQSIVRPMIEEAAAQYAKEQGITPRSGMSMGSDCG